MNKHVLLLCSNGVVKYTKYPMKKITPLGLFTHESYFSVLEMRKNSTYLFGNWNEVMTFPLLSFQNTCKIPYQSMMRSWLLLTIHIRNEFQSQHGSESQRGSVDDLLWNNMLRADKHFGTIIIRHTNLNSLIDVRRDNHFNQISRKFRGKILWFASNPQSHQ